MSSDSSEDEAATPRRSQRKKKMSLRAVEHVALKPRNFSTDDENKLDDYIDLCQATRDCKVLLEKQSLIEQMVKTPRTNRSKIKEAITKHMDLDDTVEDETAVGLKTSKLKTSKLGPAKKNRYLIKADDFFSNTSSKKAVTSNHNLDKLEMPRLAQTEVQEVISSMKLSDEHDKRLNDLIETHRSYFSKWWCLLHQNFNILLYGLGSKHNILQMFQEECLFDSNVIVVNGLFPKLSIKEVVESIIVDVLQLKDCPANIYEACDLIKKNYHTDETDKSEETDESEETEETGESEETEETDGSEESEETDETSDDDDDDPDEIEDPEHLYIIIHNIDGKMLQNNKSQNILANLASIRNVHLIASIDHINAPLIWDIYKLRKFNFSWWDTTSFLPYIKETTFESSMMVQNTSFSILSALRNVFLSLTTNSRGIFNIIVKHQLKNNNNQYYQGLLFKDLYLLCRKAFLVSSDLALRAQLNEFVDHKMVKYRRSIDGSETLIIPISNSLLQQFLDSQPD